jgi:hypothetical protein
MRHAGKVKAAVRDSVGRGSAALSSLKQPVIKGMGPGRVSSLSQAERNARAARWEKNVRMWSAYFEHGRCDPRRLPPDLSELHAYMLQGLMPTYRALQVGDRIEAAICTLRDRSVLCAEGVVVLAPAFGRVAVKYSRIGDEVVRREDAEEFQYDLPAGKAFRLVDLRFLDVSPRWIVSGDLEEPNADADLENGAEPDEAARRGVSRAGGRG